MKKLALVVFLVLIAVMGLALRAYAASDTVTVTGQTNAKIVLSIDNTTVAFGAFDPDVAQTRAVAFTVTVKSNKAYDYSVEAPATFTGVGTADAPVIGHMEFRRVGWTNFASGSNDPLPGALKTAGTNYAYDLRLTFGYDEDPNPASYTAGIVPTALQ